MKAKIYESIKDKHASELKTNKMSKLLASKGINKLTMTNFRNLVYIEGKKRRKEELVVLKKEINIPKIQKTVAT